MLSSDVLLKLCHIGGKCVCGLFSAFYPLYEEVPERLSTNLYLVDIALTLCEVCTKNLLGGGATPTFQELYTTYRDPLHSIRVFNIICRLVIAFHI